MEKKNDEQGSVTLEAAIILPIFCALFMALNGFFFTFNAQNQISHALIQSASSLGLDPYLNRLRWSSFVLGWTRRWAY